MKILSADGPRHLKLLWASFLTLGMALLVLNEEFSETMVYMAGLSAPILLEGVLVAIATVSISICFSKLHPLFRWSWFKLFENTSGANVYAMPLHMKWIGLIYGPLLIVNIPKIAEIEEMIFRDGTSNWKQGVIRSLIFGFSHCLVGVPFSAAFALTGVGLWLTHHYMNGGTANSTLYHTAFNVVLIGFSYSAVIASRCKKPRVTEVTAH